MKKHCAVDIIDALVGEGQVARVASHGSEVFCLVRCDQDRLCMQINRGDSNIEVALVSPGEDRTGDIARAGGDIQNGDCLAGFPGFAEMLEVTDRNAGVAEEAVDLADEFKAASELGGIDVGGVHPFFFALPGVKKTEHGVLFDGDGHRDGPAAGKMGYGEENRQIGGENEEPVDIGNEREGEKSQDLHGTRFIA